MTPETYLQLYHNQNPALSDALRAGTAPACPLPAEKFCPCSHRPAPQPSQDCCCKRAMAEALRLLCDPLLAELVDFNTFFFLTDSLTVGGALTVPSPSTTPADNIESAEASFHRFSPCNNDLLEIDATAYFATPLDDVIALEDVDQLSICALKAVAFELIDLEDTEENSSAYRRAIRALRRTLDSEGGDTSACGSCAAHCDTHDCCCTSGVLNELSARNLSRVATFTAGPLVLQNLSVLGSLGGALLLGNETLRRFYLVCAETIEALG